MEKLHVLKRMLCREMDELAEKLDMKKSISGTDLEHLSMLTKTLKNVYRIEELEEGEYSERGMWTARGYSDRGYSHEGRAGHVNAGGSSNRGDYRGDYSERRGRDARGRYTSYSMDDGQRDMVEGIREMMDRENLSNNSREILRKAMEQLER